MDKELIEKVRNIAAVRRTTLTESVGDCLEKLAAEGVTAERRPREQEALERSFEEIHVHTGKRTWKREDLHDRS